MNIPIAQITTFDRVRQASRPQVEALVASIREVGLLNPITVTATDDGFALVAGMHRLEACRALGMTAVPAITLDLDANQRIIAECDENLCAPSLTAAERAEFTRRRKAAYEALHPETVREATLKRGDNLPSRQVGETGPAPRFTADTAAATGQSERAVQRDAERGEKVSDEALGLIKGTRLDTGRYLDSIKNLSAEDQVVKVQADLASPEPRPTPAPAQRSARNGLTAEALEEDNDALREQVASLKASLEKSEAETKRLKALLSDLQADDSHAVIRRLNGEIEHLKSKVYRESRAADQERNKAYKLKKRVEELEALPIDMGAAA